MLETSTAPRGAATFVGALLLAVSACSDPATSPGAVNGASGGHANAAGGQVSHGGASSGGAGTSSGGRDQSSAGVSGAPVSSGGAPSTAGSSPGGSGVTAGSGGSAAGSGSGGAPTSGGTAGTAGTSSAPVFSTDPTTFGGQPRCQGFDVCESFESTELGALPSGFTLAGYGTRKVGVSADRAMRGARALKIEVSAQSAVTSWLTRGSLGALAAQHFGRAFFRIENPAPAEFVHFDLFEGSGPYQGHSNAVRFASTGTGVGTSSSNWSFIYNVQPSGNGAGSEFGTEGNRSAHARAGDWMCLEWSFDATEQLAQYYLDGAAIDYLRIDTERAEIPVFDSIAVGFGKYQNTGAFLVYLDEVAFDGERIGCNN